MITNITNAQKQKLRRCKTFSDRIKAIIYGGNLAGPEMAQQFNYDVRVYNLYEAILYVESYERRGSYRHNTAARAMQAALDEIK